MFLRSSVLTKNVFLTQKCNLRLVVEYQAVKSECSFLRYESKTMLSPIKKAPSKSPESKFSKFKSVVFEEGDFNKLFGKFLLTTMIITIKNQYVVN